MSYPDGAVAPLTNDLSSYITVDVDAARGSLVTTQRAIVTSLWVGDATGNAGREIVPPTAYPGVTFASVGWVGDRVYFDNGMDDRVVTTAIAPDSGARQEIVDGFFTAITSDGNTVVFMRRGEGLWKLDRATGSLVQLVGERSAAWPALTPDDRSVVFLSARSGLQSPWIMPVEGGEPTQIANEPAGGGNALSISADGRVLFIGSSGAAGVPVAIACEIPACSNRREVPWVVSGSPPRWTPDGREIAYVDASGANIWALPLDGGQARQLTSFAVPDDGTRIVDFEWSRDGARLAIMRMRISDDIVLLRGLQP
jgi:hypothetical protein